MKRNWEVVRAILLAMEEKPADGSVYDESHFPKISPEVFNYHAELLIEAGLVTGINVSSMDGPASMLFRLTWAGHEFLDAIKSDTAWTKIKEKATEKGVDLSFDTIIELGKWAARVLLSL